MSEEYIEAFGRITLHTEYDNDSSYDCLNFEDDCNLVEKALQRLETIDNANPSEALKEVNEIINSLEEYNKLMRFHKAPETATDIMLRKLDIVKQALIKAQEQEVDIIHYKGTVDNLRRDNAILKEIKNEQEKVLEIIKKKEVNIQVFNQCEDVETYNNVYKKQKDRQLTQEEFDLLKRCVNG